MWRRAFRFTLGLGCCLTATLGCSRAFYRRQADRDVAAIYAEKRAEEAYNLPPLPGIEVDPRSRFFDPSPDDCPTLPFPIPVLNGYALPELSTGDPNLPKQITDGDTDLQLEAPVDTEQSGTKEKGTEANEVGPEVVPIPAAEPEMELSQPTLQPTGYSMSLSDHAGGNRVSGDPLVATNDRVRLAQLIRQYGDASEKSDAELRETLVREQDEPVEPDAETASDESGLQIVPIPPDYWQQLPDTCLPRMLEFGTVRTEYRRSYPGVQPEELAGMLSDAPRLTLPMICELAAINSRELQTRKESLYQAALVLSARRYEYVLRPLSRGNGTGATYTHVRLGGTSQTGLAVPTEVAVTKTTAMAGQFLSSFANDVLLTFNGQNGFSTDIRTELLFGFEQTIFQRDRRFEGLTRAERNVIYEARNLIRYRRDLFVNLASRYYQLLLTYRQIEISCQAFFSNLRAFLQGRAEYLKAGRIPRVQVDQFEQNALGSRSDLVGDCNALESALDRLKLDIGLPPEMPLNIDLRELEALTSSDELTVTRQLVLRTRQALIDAVEGPLRDRDAAVNGATVLVKRLQDTLRVRREIGGDQAVEQAERMTRQTEHRLALLEARLKADQLEAIRRQELRSDLPSRAKQGGLENDLAPAVAGALAPPPLKQFARTMDLIRARLDEASRAITYRSDLEGRDDDASSRQAIQQARAEQDELSVRWDKVIDNRELGELPGLVEVANKLLARSEALADRIVGDLVPERDDALEQEIIQAVSDTVALVDQVDSSDLGGLDEVEVQNENAMLLALFQRLDLMNQRGAVADARRQIKLAADDLRAILDFRANQNLTLRRLAGDDHLDGSTTRLSMALDTPLNRRIERNAYRVALINYNQTRRDLIEQEDTIKFAVREDLRQLRLRRNQYEISVARAALAYERLVSTRLQLQLAVGNVVARDFLEAQQAYTSALSSVAGNHISFILGRIGLFFDTESIQLDQNGYWTAGQTETLDLPPVPDFSDANPNPYGRLPDGLHYSDEVRANH